jgi:hypothetical protein
MARKAPKKKASPRKSGTERRKAERRRAPRRLRKTASAPQRRTKKSRRLAARRSGVRRTSDTYLGKIEEFRQTGKKQEMLPPLEEDVITEGLETVSGDEPPANEPESDPTDPAPESENN